MYNNFITTIFEYQIKKQNKMDIGKMRMSEAYPYLKVIADEFDLRLNRYTEFKLARVILATRL